MKYAFSLSLLALAIVVMQPHAAQAEILAMMNYESKSPDSLKALKISGPPQREEGIAVMDVDPKSANFGKILIKIPLPSDMVAHHLFYDRTQSKVYLTALGNPVLHVIDMKRFPYRLQKVDVPNCAVAEDIVFSEDNSTWYLTCMGTGTVIVGDVASDKVRGEIKTPRPYPHGIATHAGIDRALTTDTVRASDLGDAGESVGVIKLSTNEVLGTVKVSKKPSPAGEAPVELLFAPGSNPPTALVTNMYGGSLWAIAWNPQTKGFDASEAYDFASENAGVPLEMYFNDAGDRLYVTTAKPGKLHIFDVSGGVKAPKHLKTIDIAEGAHHVAFTKDFKLAFVQNSLLNLPGMSDGSITVVDLEKEKVIASIDTLKEAGYNPNSIILLPEWNHPAGH